MIFTLNLLRPVTSDSAYHSILLALEAISGTLDISFGLSGVVFSLASSMFLLAGLLPRSSTSHVANSLDESALDGVELATGLAVEYVRRSD